MCVRRIDIAYLSTNFLFDLVAVLTVWYFSLSFYDYILSLIFFLFFKINFEDAWLCGLS